MELIFLPLRANVTNILGYRLAWRRQHQTSSIRGFICATIIFVVFVGALSYIYQPAVNERRLDTIQTNQTPTLQCSNPPVRREWRGLTVDEKEDFTRSVNCLSRVPSTWGLNGTLYDDFSALHGGIGSWCTFYRTILAGPVQLATSEVPIEQSHSV